MRILLANKFLFIQGGAESSFFRTCELLKARGHVVAPFAMHHPHNVRSEFESYFVSHVDYDNSTPGEALRSAGRLLYSLEARRNIDRLIRDFKPDLVHLNNIYHQISPSILHSIKRHRLPVVMSLRDYKLACASYQLVAHGEICEACAGGRHYHCFLKSCVKGSRAKSLLNTVEMILHHKVLHLYELIDCFVSPSLFLKAKMRDMGIRFRIEVVPNFVFAEEYTPSYGWTDRCCVYFGRLSHEKGLPTLIRAMKGVDLRLKIIGRGPMEEALRHQARQEGVDNVEFLGFLSGAALNDQVRRAMFIVIPSEWYENNPRAVIEAFALGKPALGSRIGGIPELVRDNDTGLTFSPGDTDDLREKITGMAGDTSRLAHWGQRARRLVEEELNAERHYERLMAVYAAAGVRA